MVRVFWLVEQPRGKSDQTMPQCPNTLALTSEILGGQFDNYDVDKDFVKKFLGECLVPYEVVVAKPSSSTEVAELHGGGRRFCGLHSQDHSGFHGRRGTEGTPTETPAQGRPQHPQARNQDEDDGQRLFGHQRPAVHTEAARFCSCNIFPLSARTKKNLARGV